MTDHFTPRTDQVRAVYMLDSESEQATGAAFDRWLAGHDAEIRDQAARTVEALNAQYRDRDGLDGQRGFSVEAAGLIRSLDKRA